MASQTERYVDPELLNLDGGLFQDLLLRAPFNGLAAPMSPSIALAPASSSLVKIDQGWEELSSQDVALVEEEPDEIEIDVDVIASPQDKAPPSAAKTLEVAVPVGVLVAQQEAAPASAASTVEVAVPVDVVVTQQEEAPSSAATTLEVAIPAEALSAMREPVEIIEPAPVSASEEQPVRSQDRPTPIGVFERPTPVSPPPLSVRRWRDRRAVGGACAAAAVSAALLVFFGFGSIRMRQEQTPQPAAETPQGHPQVAMVTPPLAAAAPLKVEEPPPGGATVVPPGPTFPAAPPAPSVMRTANERATGEAALLAAAHNVNPTLYDALAAPRPFRRSAAAVAISSIGRGAKGCIAKGAAGGAVPVRVVYAPSGQVTSAAVQGGPFAGSAAGSCIARVLRGARIEPFDGSATAVTTTLRIR